MTKKLGEIFNLRNGYTPSRRNNKFWENGTIPWFRMDDIRQNGHILTDSIQHITSEAVKGDLFKANSIILANSATIGEHALILNDFLCNQRFTNFEIKEEFKDSLDPKYLYYKFYLIDEWCLNHVNKSSFASVDISRLKKYEISFPSIDKQKEIVAILDQFECLIKHLEMELELRQKQFEWYLKTLISNQTFTKRKIKDIAEFRRGSFPQPYGNQEWYGGDESMPFIQVYDIQDNFTVSSETKKQISKLAQPKSVYVPPGKVIVSLQGSIGRVAKTERASFIDRTIAVFTSIDESINIDYFVYALKYIFDIKKQNARGTTIKTITKNEFSNFLIPIPSINRQKEIVQTLSSILELRKLLEQELSLRQKQFEYYRNTLLVI